MRIARPLAALLAALLTLSVVGSAAGAATISITNGTQFRDTGGAPVHAHGGGILKVGAYYYWLGRTGTPTTASGTSPSTARPT